MSIPSRMHTFSTLLSTMADLWIIINDLFLIPDTVKFYFLKFNHRRFPLA